MGRVTLQSRDLQQPCAFDKRSTCNLIVDNNNESEIQYSGSWVQNKGDTNTPSGETSHSTGQPGSSMFISFHGTRIAATGTIPAGNAAISANYIIDNGQVITASVSGSSDGIFHQSLFTSPVLSDGPHNLTVQVVETGSGRNYTFQNFQIPISENVDAGSSSGDKVGSGSHGKSLAIVGGIVGAVSFLLLIILCLFWFRRKRRSLMPSAGERQLHPNMYYAHSPSDTYYGDGEKYPSYPASIIDTDSKFTFARHRDIARESGPSWVSINRPPSIPQSALISDRDFPDWSTYKGSSVIIPQAQTEQSRFSPYTSRALSSRDSMGSIPQLPPRGASESGPRSPSLRSSSSAPYERRMI